MIHRIKQNNNETENTTKRENSFAVCIHKGKQRTSNLTPKTTVSEMSIVKTTLGLMVKLILLPTNLDPRFNCFKNAQCLFGLHSGSLTQAVKHLCK